MNNFIANVVLDDINLENEKDLLQVISKVNDNVKIEFDLPIESIVDMFNYYIKHHAEHIKDIENYDCICPEVFDKYGDGHYFFTLNSCDDDESKSDIDFIISELKRQFGVNFKKDCELRELFTVLLMDCSEYDIIQEHLKIKIYYKTYNYSWLKNFLEEY